MGARCNTTLSPPACQTLYCGASETPCSASWFCESRTCFRNRCLVVDGGLPFGAALPAVIHWLNVDDGGFTRPLVFVSDDARNDCASLQAAVEYGRRAFLTTAGPFPELVDGASFPWISDGQARRGEGPRPAVLFAQDDLSGAALKLETGTLTILKVPTPADRTLSFSLRSADGGFSGSWVARPVCP